MSHCHRGSSIRDVSQLENNLASIKRKNELQSSLWSLTATSVNLHVKICRTYEQHITMGFLEGKEREKRAGGGGGLLLRVFVYRGGVNQVISQIMTSFFVTDSTAPLKNLHL